jgi:hypothetical protein
MCLVMGTKMSKLSKNIIIILVLCLVIKLLFTYRSNEKVKQKSLHPNYGWKVVHSDEKYFKNEQKENGKKIIIKRNATSLG